VGAYFQGEGKVEEGRGSILIRGGREGERMGAGLLLRETVGRE